MARAKTSDKVKDWERQRKQAEAARRAGRDETDVGDRMRELKPISVGAFVAVPEDTGLHATVRCDGLTTQQLRSLTRIFEDDGYTVTQGRTL